MCCCYINPENWIRRACCYTGKVRQVSSPLMKCCYSEEPDAVKNSASSLCIHCSAIVPLFPLSVNRALSYAGIQAYYCQTALWLKAFGNNKHNIPFRHEIKAYILIMFL